jgi:hypothetical protein
MLSGILRPDKGTMEIAARAFLKIFGQGKFFFISDDPYYFSNSTR